MIVSLFNFHVIVELPTLASLSEEKPIYTCSMTNELLELSIDGCELLLDSGNTAFDLLLSYRDSCKFQLKPSKETMKVNGLTGTVIVKLLPSLMVTFALLDKNGNLTERSASLDAWIMKSELDTFLARPDLSLYEKTQIKEGRVRVNNPSPVKHQQQGSANLGKSGCKKLKLKYDFETDEISFIDSVEEEDLPEI